MILLHGAGRPKDESVCGTQAHGGVYCCHHPATLPRGLMKKARVLPQARCAALSDSGRGHGACQCALAPFLLMAHDRLQCEEHHLTHEFLSITLGSVAQVSDRTARPRRFDESRLGDGAGRQQAGKGRQWPLWRA